MTVAKCCWCGEMREVAGLNYGEPMCDGCLDWKMELRADAEGDDASPEIDDDPLWDYDGEND